MASNYFDEHDCEPTADSGPDVHTLLHWARLLLSDVRQFYLQNGGFGLPEELQKAPPASKDFVQNLPEKKRSTKEHKMSYLPPRV